MALLFLQSAIILGFVKRSILIKADVSDSIKSRRVVVRSKMVILRNIGIGIPAHIMEISIDYGLFYLVHIQYPLLLLGLVVPPSALSACLSDIHIHIAMVMDYILVLLERPVGTSVRLLLLIVMLLVLDVGPLSQQVRLHFVVFI